MKKIIIAVIFLFPIFVANAQQKMKLDIEKCRNMAVQNSEVLKIAQENVVKASNERKAAKSNFFPNIAVSANALYNKNKIEEELYLPTKVFDPTTGQIKPNIFINPITGQPVFDPKGNPIFNTYAYMPVDFTLYGVFTAGVSAQQPIFVGGKIVTGNKMAEIGQNMAAENKILKKNELIYQVDKSYYLYLAVKEKVKVAQNYKNMLDELLKVVENSYQTGMVAKQDLLKVKVKYNEAVLKTQQAESALKLIAMDLCRIIGADLDTEPQINDSISGISYKEPTQKQDVQNRPEYKLLQKQTEMAQQNVKMVRSDYLPTAGISVGYNYYNIFMDGMDDYDEHGFNAMLNVKIPITNFGKRSGKIQIAKSNYQIKRMELENAQKLLQLEMEQAKLNLKDAHKALILSEDIIKQAEENMKVSKDNYELGMETLVNLLQAQAQWQDAKSKNIDAMTDFKIKESNYMRVTTGYEN